MYEKSDYYNERKRCLCELIVPTFSNIRERWGSTFSEVFFETCPNMLKPLVGLTPPLDGAGDDLWTSPSDLLLEKVCLKPPLTTRCMKALTHQGIMEIGSIVEQKYWNEMELEKRRALTNQEELLKFICEHEKKTAVCQARVEEQEKCAMEKKQMAKEFAEMLEEELALLESKMLIERDILMKEQADELEKIWQQKLEEAVQETVEKLTAQFLEELKQREAELTRQFEITTMKQEMKMKLNIEEERNFCHDTFRQLKHNLECKNIANLMYVLSIERRKCENERKAAEIELHKQIFDLENTVMDKNDEIMRIEEKVTEKEKQIAVREECLLEVLKQFQKFIYFALRACPTQAEFLICVEKLMIFELTQTIIKSELKADARLAKRIFCWKKTNSEISDQLSHDALLAKDYHSCLNELTPPSSEGSLKSTDDLPAFYFNKHLYVREDFRNMISQGIEISPSNELWSKDVQHVMDVLKSSDKSVFEDELLFDESNHKKNEDMLYSRRRSSVRFVKKRSSAQPPIPGYEEGCMLFNTKTATDSSSVFSSTPLAQIDEQTSLKCRKKSSESVRPKTSESTIGSKLFSKRRSTLKYRDVPINIDYTKIGEEENKKTLLSARNSMEVMKEILPKLTQEKTSADVTSPGVGILAVKDSLCKHRLSLKMPETILSDIDESFYSSKLTKPRLELKDDDVPIVESRLTMVRDSVVLHQISLENTKMFDAESVDSNLPTKYVILPSTCSSRKPSFEVARKPSKGSLKKPSADSECYGSRPQLSGDTLPSPRGSIHSSMMRKASKLPTTRDSAEILRESKRMLESQLEPTDSKTSRMSTARDSLEIYTDSLKNLEVTPKRSKDSIEILDGGLIQQSPPKTPDSPKSTMVTDVEDEESRVVKISHIEVVKIEDDLNVAFENEPAVYDTASVESSELPWKVYTQKLPQKKDVVRDDFLTKASEAKIEGNKNAKEHLQRTSEFVLTRADSLIGIIKNHPDLIRIFTSCTK